MTDRSAPGLGSAQRLVRTFVLGSALSAVAILVLVGFGLREVNVVGAVRHASEESVRVGAAVVANERVLLDRLRQSPGAIPRGPDLDWLDSRIAPQLAPYGILKLKLFDHSGRIYYSTDRSVIGARDMENVHLRHALEGEVTSEITSKNSTRDIKGETRLGVDVVETYFPVRDMNGQISGAGEIYTDVTRFRADTVNTLRISLALLGFVLLVCFGGLYLVVRPAARRLHDDEEALQRMAVTDALTGAFNRGFLMTRASEEFERARRLRMPAENGARLSCIMLDIDHFKRINDDFGHQAGDAILRDVVARVRETIRAYDVLGRFGGEEFLVLAPHSSLAAAGAVAERILEAVRARPFEFSGTQIPLTLSAGVATSTESDMAIDDMIRRADQALYDAKRQGRDRVATAAPSGSA